MRLASLQLDLAADAHESTVREALRAGKAERRKAGRRAKGEKLKPEEIFEIQCRNRALPPFAMQAAFALKMGRRWKFDFCWHEYHLAIEVEGLVVRKLAGQLVCMGRHASISGFKEDAIKYATAALLGWTVVRFEQSQVKDGTAIDYTMRILEARGWKPDAAR